MDNLITEQILEEQPLEDKDEEQPVEDKDGDKHEDQAVEDKAEEHIIAELMEELITNIIKTCSHKRRLSEEDASSQFHIGLFSGSPLKKRSFLKDVKSKKSKKPKKYKKIMLKEEPIIKEDPVTKQSRIIRLFAQNNPYYVHLSIRRILHEDKYPPPPFQKQKAIQIIIPNIRPTYMPHTSAYLHIRYFRGTLLDWQLKLIELSLLKPAFSELKPTIKYKFLTNDLYGPSPQFAKAAMEIYAKNQKTRWCFKRLLVKWLFKKAQARILDVDLISLETVPKEEQILITCIKSRSIYVFSGSSLLKTVRSSLESQISSISNITAPKNPFTNVPFTYGQLITLTNELGGWCVKKGKAYPAIIALYRESNFSTIAISRLHNNYLQYNATKAFIFNDDVAGIFFLENLEVLIDAYEQYLPRFVRYLDPELFRVWLHEDKDSIMLKNWKQLICDYWHFKQTDHLIRPRWVNEFSIIEDIEILLRASEQKLRAYF